MKNLKIRIGFYKSPLLKEFHPRNSTYLIQISADTASSYFLRSPMWLPRLLDFTTELSPLESFWCEVSISSDPKSAPAVQYMIDSRLTPPVLLSKHVMGRHDMVWAETREIHYTVSTIPEVMPTNTPLCQCIQALHMAQCTGDSTCLSSQIS